MPKGHWKRELRAAARAKAAAEAEAEAAAKAKKRPMLPPPIAPKIAEPSPEKEPEISKAWKTNGPRPYGQQSSREAPTTKYKKSDR